MLSKIILGASIFISGSLITNKPVPIIDDTPVQKWIEEIPYNDEYDFNQYEITEINGDEINGIALDNISEDNMGIVLSKKYDGVKFNLKVGDKILVVFEKDIEDAIVDIKKVD